MENKSKFSFFNSITDLITWVRSLFFNKELELSIIGLQNAGKTTFVNVLANNKFDEDTIPTIGFNYKSLKKGKIQFKLWDLGGQPRFRDSWEKYCKGTDCIIYVLDSADSGSMDVSKLQLQQLLTSHNLIGTPLLVLGNKNDLENAYDEQKIIKALELDLLKDRTVAVYSISCKNMINIENVFNWLSKLKPRK